MNLLMMRMDWTNATATFVRSDGREATLPLPTNEYLTTGISCVSWFPGLPVAHVLTTKGDKITVELPQRSELSPRRNRPVIYLDQNHWSNVAKAIHVPDKVSTVSEREAALHIVELAAGGKVILPMSAGHMSETCKWPDGAGRYRLALTILQLSGGWQMRDPLEVRRLELRGAYVSRYRSSSLPQPAVFTLEADAVHGTTRQKRRYKPPGEFSDDDAFLLQTLVCLSANFETMLSSDSIEMGTSPGWVDHFQQFTDWLGMQPRHPHLRRRRTNGIFINDLRKELVEEAARASITPEEMVDWIRNHSDDDIAELPSLGLFREVLHEKLINPGTRWESNDLTDLMYLTCAAGYADHVVGERSLTAQMEQTLRRLDRPVRVHRNLTDLVQAI